MSIKTRFFKSMGIFSELRIYFINNTFLEVIMEINRESVDKLLSLNDWQLKMIIQKIANESGIDPSQYNIDTNSIESIRRALSTATDADLLEIAEQYEQNQKNKR